MRRNVLVAAFAALLLSACGGGDSADSAAESPSSDAEVGTSETEVGSGELAADFPVDAVALVPGTILSSTHTEPTKWNVLMTIDGDPVEIMAEASALLEDAGFTPDGIQAETMTQWATDAYSVTLVVGAEDDGSGVSVNYAVTAR